MQSGSKTQSLRDLLPRFVDDVVRRDNVDGPHLSIEWPSSCQRWRCRRGRFSTLPLAIRHIFLISSRRRPCQAWSRHRRPMVPSRFTTETTCPWYALALFCVASYCHSLYPVPRLMVRGPSFRGTRSGSPASACRPSTPTSSFPRPRTQPCEFGICGRAMYLSVLRGISR